jgi:hypothetical protein
MKLHGVSEDDLYGTDHQTVLVRSGAGEFDAVGELPIPSRGKRGLAFRLKVMRGWKSSVERVVGRFPSVNLWASATGTLLASAVRWLYVSNDGGQSWDVAHQFPDSSGPMGILPSAFCEHDGALYVGEYPLDSDETPRVLRSRDGGQTWDTVLALPEVRHIHAIETDPYTGDLWMTTGDAADECRIGRLRDGEFEVVGSGGQQWRAVQPVFAPTGLLWGVDSVYTDDNPIFALSRSEFDSDDPTVRRLSTVENSVYYGTSLSVDGEHWVVFSTAIEPGVDSTGPDDQHSDDGRAAVVAASSATDYTDWVELVTYRKRRVPSDVWPVRSYLPTANAYVYLAVDDDGLLINPYNTANDDGRVLRIPGQRFAELDGSGSSTESAVAIGPSE